MSTPIIKPIPRTSNLSRVQESQEKRARRTYSTPSKIRTQLTQQFAKNMGRIPGFAWKQADVVRGSRGDTVVEVMISVTILSMALAGAYALASASLRNGSSANQRTEALSLAQSQIELLSNAQTHDPNFAAKYQIAAPYCINPDATRNTNVGSDKLCDSYGGSNYNLGISYASSSGIFTITAQWNNADSAGGKTQMNLYYKLPGTY